MTAYLITQHYVSRTGVDSCEGRTDTLGIALASSRAEALSVVPASVVRTEDRWGPGVYPPEATEFGFACTCERRAVFLAAP